MNADQDEEDDDDDDNDSFSLLFCTSLIDLCLGLLFPQANKVEANHRYEYFDHE